MAPGKTTILGRLNELEKRVKSLEAALIWSMLPYYNMYGLGWRQIQVNRILEMPHEEIMKRMNQAKELIEDDS